MLMLIVRVLQLSRKPQSLRPRNVADHLRLSLVKAFLGEAPRTLIRDPGRSYPAHLGLV